MGVVPVAKFFGENFGAIRKRLTFKQLKIDFILK